MSAILADVSFSTESLVTVTGVVATLWTALVMLWRSNASAWAAERADLRAQRDALLRVLYRLELTDEIPPEVPHGDLPPPRANGG